MRSIIERTGRFFNWLAYTGLWIPVPLTVLTVYIIAFFNPRYNWTMDMVTSLFAFSFVIPLYVWSMNSIAKRNGMEKFPLFPTNTSTNPMYQTSGRMAAMNKRPPKELLFDKPQGIVFGKYGAKYVCIEPGKKGAAHTLVVGGSGSGKTSSVIADVLLASNLQKDEKRMFTSIVVDVKGELEQKFFYPDDKLAVFNPRDRNKWGFDFLYDINDSSSEADILSTLRRVVYSLVPMNANLNGDRFWIDGPRNILLGLFLYSWEHKGYRTLPDLVDFVLSKNLKELINEVLADVDEYSVISKFLVSFGGEDVADETISSLSMNVGNALQLIATDETIRYLLRECDRKITPTFIEQGINIDLQIEDAFLEQYSPILRLALSTCCNAICRRPEGSKPVLMILDELGRLAHAGQIEGLQQVLQIGRSRGCNTILCLQSWSAMESVYHEGDCKDMLNNLQYRLVLQSAPDAKDTTDMCIKAFGKYLEKKRSVSTGKSKSYSYSFEEKNVLEETDLLSLPEKNKVILMSPYGAFLLNKCQYFNYSILKRIAEDISEKRNLPK